MSRIYLNEYTRVESNAVAFGINGASGEVENSFSEPHNVGIRRKDAVPAGDTFEYTFPAHSITLLKLDVQAR